ncbi:hypothetical protein OB2597_14309 [Pseudooceanicola batsensis HTCC2597]|uniref:Uncharacterized protein n=1 Tax=Pseudooceanicola batsensis (strain ATCC BAA-863 / DSM 15984 / KCTC 12145 / HTCC2597) TaxID=252305 RepID=A3U402_PSEBH|nr:hypothetical protein [Pseudooceanicola batsensis]EAQ01138.1 hypothetical protein OB2597_14309 [Pseudooceanicola batsensis HTCC2597]
MAEKTGKTDMQENATADRLRDEIDRGGTGDKVAFSDPAAAPLGTDDEAAGHPPSPEQVRRAMRHEAPRDEASDDKQTPHELLTVGQRMLKSVTVIAALAVGVVLVILAL